MMCRSFWTAAVVLLAGCALAAQTPPKTQPQKPDSPASRAQANGLPKPQPLPPKTTIVEQIVARVNDKIITTTDYDSAKKELEQSLQDTAQSAGKTVTPVDLAKADHGLLANLIDNQLLEQRAADLGLSAETQTILQLDKVRKQNHLATMEDLQKAVEAQGENYQDYEQQIKNSLLMNMVIQQDVAPRISQPTPKAIAAYYEAHKSDFVTPDEVQLSEILIKTTGKPETEQKRLQSLADQVQQRAAAGEDFGKLAQRYSDGSTAANGGDIGFERRDQLQAALAQTLFALPVGGVSPVEKISDGYLILKVTAQHTAGQQTLQEATPQITNVLYQQALLPEVQNYLVKLRQQAYITVKPGYVDAGASAANAGVDLTKFQRVLPSDLPKPTDKPSSGGMSLGGGQ